MSARHMLVLLPLLGVAACDSPIVGAECRPGFVICDGRCVDLDRDPNNCGGCGQSCGVYTCSLAECSDERRDASIDGGRRDAGARDGAVEAGIGSDRSDASVGPGGVGAPFLPDGGLSFPPDSGVGAGCEIGETRCFGLCVDLQSNHYNCGECGLSCGADGYCVAGMCRDICEPPLMLCNGQCLLFDTWRHCGGCNHACASGVCEDGVCADAVPGHVVVFGHDFSGGGVTANMQRIAGSALFLTAGAPVHTVVYEGSARQRSIDGVVNASERIADEDGRAWQREVVTATDLGASLLGAEALIIHAQVEEDDDELIELGEEWGVALWQFVVRGGVVLLFETDTDNNAGTYQILEPSGLFAAAERERIPSQLLTVVAPGVGIAARSTRTYRSGDVTVRFLDVTSPGDVIVTDGDGEAVIVHRVVPPPAF